MVRVLRFASGLPVNRRDVDRAKRASAIACSGASMITTLWGLMSALHLLNLDVPKSLAGEPMAETRPPMRLSAASIKSIYKVLCTAKDIPPISCTSKI